MCRKWVIFLKEQLIITIGREFGSGGHFIAQTIADKLGIELLDKELLEQTVISSGYSEDILTKYDEKPKNVLLSRRIGNYSNSLEENVANKVFELIRAKAQSGASFVVVGRCAEHVLRGNENMLSFFICANKEDKIKRITELYQVSEAKAKDMMRETDKKRKTYHNYYSDIKWGSSLGYDITINTSKLGIEKTADALIVYAKVFKNQ